MLAAVTPSAPGYEGLSGYFLGGGGAGGGGGPPARVPSALAPSPRLATTPGAAVPGAPAPIPTSSQKPTQNTNVRIPYSRFMYTSPTDDAAPRDLQRGDVVFAHRNSLAMGRGANRLVKCTGLPQLNDMLERGGEADERDTSSDRGGFLDLRTPAVRKRVKAARLRHYRDEVARAEFELGALSGRSGERAIAARAAAEVQKQRAELRLAAAEQFDPAAPIAAPRATDYDYAADAAAVPLLRQWTLDGVLINVDDDVLDVETPRDARNDGVLLNVAIAGPTPMRNAARGVGALYDNQLLPRNAWTPQLVDATPLARDSVVALLVGTPVAINDGEDARDPAVARYYRFRWKLGSFRQWYQIANGGTGGGNGATRLEGLSRDDVFFNWGAYRIGCVTDTNLVESPGKDQQIMVSVAVEWLAPLTLLERAGVGAYMKPRDDDADADEDEGEAARDERQRRIVQAYDVEVQRRALEAAPPAANAAGAAR